MIATLAIIILAWAIGRVAYLTVRLRTARNTNRHFTALARMDAQEIAHLRNRIDAMVRKNNGAA